MPGRRSPISLGLVYTFGGATTVTLDGWALAPCASFLCCSHSSRIAAHCARAKRCMSTAVGAPTGVGGAVAGAWVRVRCAGNAK